jgi:hypothetical protein
VKNGIIFNVLELTEILSKVTANGFVTHVLFESQNKCTGKSLSEGLIFASTNSQYDERLFIEPLKHSHFLTNYLKLQILASYNNLRIGQDSLFAKF